VALLLLLLNVTGVQNYIARRATSLLAGKLHTRVSIDHVRIDFANRLLLRGLYVEDRKGDTLLYAGEAEVKMTDWFFLKKEKPAITYLGLHHAYANLVRTAGSSEWNYQFVIDAFNTGKKDTTVTQNEFELDLKHLDLRDVRFHSRDAWAGDDMDIDVGAAAFDGREIDLKKRVIDLRRVAIEGATVAMRSYKGGKPRSLKSRTPAPIDTTAFNPGRWLVRVGDLSLDDCRYSLTASTRPALAREFDPDHMLISGIDIRAADLRIAGDTLRARLDHLAANERCGIAIKDMQADVSVSPNAATLDDLLLKTDRSIIRRSYAMRYERFPDFTDYISKVRMEADLRDAVVDPRDVAFFAPVFLEYFPSMMRASGQFAGTVADFSMRRLRYRDADNTVTGNLTMKGLPDIYQTLITFTDGSVHTSGEGIFRFAPMLREGYGFDMAQLHTIDYSGSFTGYIDNFAADGTLRTNLGTVTSRSRLAMPQFDTRHASYSSDIQATNFQLGQFLHQPDIGAVSFNGAISGRSFEADQAALKVNVFISSIALYGYNYTNITADGILGDKKFDGKILINDPNLSLSFNGAADLSGKEPVINAKAHLLQSNLQALHITDEPIEASADFDVDATGSTIDNFLGYALLNNINVHRAGKRLDIDSIRVQSATGKDGQKLLVLESNDFSTIVEGRYQLSQLPYSAQYFLAQYLPSYIPQPKKYAPDQDLKFSITTRNVDSLLRVMTPAIRGFDNSLISGSLNTSSQQLALNAKVPYGRLANVRITGLVLKGEGDFSRIKISGDAAEVFIGDSIMRLSLNLNTTIADDSIGFNITTSSPETYGTATLNGVAIAKGDSILLTMAPSEFFLNQSRWEVDGGSSVAFRKDYLAVNGLNLHSGLQRITVRSEDELLRQALIINATNLDLAQLGGAAGFSSYTPDGRINGTARITDLFRKPSVSASLKATGVKLKTDTIGEIVLVGAYDGIKGIVTLEKGSGIFRGLSSITTDGTVSFDSTSNQHLNGTITLNNAPLSWLNPVLEGYVSRLSGAVNGKITIGGTGRMPDVSGSVALEKAALRVDYLGTYYTIPEATIDLSNTEIIFAAIPLRDVYDNKAVLTGKITHERFKDFRLGLSLKSDEFEVLNLQDYENADFYGHLVAKVTSLNVRGPIDDVHMNINAEPADISHLYLPVATGGDIGTYSYVSFKQYGEEQVVATGPTSKLTINITAIINPLAEVTLILDPTTGDAINARGNGTLTLDVPAGGDLRMYGNFNIDEGDYTFTFRQLFFKRQFRLASGSSVRFSGPIEQTTLDVSAIYRTRASLYDLLTDREKEVGFILDKELADTKRQQDIDVLLTMRKNILHPEITFKLALPERRSVGTYAYDKFDRLNTNDRELFNQVASLLLIGYFIPPEGGLGGSTAAAGAITNLSEVLSTNFSAQLTNIVNKLLGDPKLSVDLKYKNYNVTDDPQSGPLNRNEVKLGLRKNLLNDRLVLEVGSAYDWGRPVSTAATSSNFNLLNDFRIQYLLSQDGRLRLNGFRTTDYDVLLTNGSNITRSGIGISWRKTFDSFSEFLHPSRYYARQQKKILEEQNKVDSTTIQKTIGTE
jgi:hypothetical protein